MGDRAGQSALKRILVLFFVLWAGCMTIGMAKSDEVCLGLSMYIVFGMHLAAKVMMATESGRRFNQTVRAARWNCCWSLRCPLQPSWRTEGRSAGAIPSLDLGALRGQHSNLGGMVVCGSQDANVQ